MSRYAGAGILFAGLFLTGCITTGEGSETVAPTVTCLFTIGDCYDRDDTNEPIITTDHGDVIKGAGRTNSPIPHNSPLND